MTTGSPLRAKAFASTGIPSEKALAVCSWQSVQWHAMTNRGTFVTSYRIMPHRHPPVIGTTIFPSAIDHSPYAIKRVRRQIVQGHGDQTATVFASRSTGYRLIDHPRIALFGRQQAFRQDLRNQRLGTVASISRFSSTPKSSAAPATFSRRARTLVECDAQSGCSDATACATRRAGTGWRACVYGQASCSC